MATQPTATPTTIKPRIGDRAEIKIVQHSQLFYWWPVWAIGFILAGVTWWDDNRMLVVPAGSTIKQLTNDSKQSVRYELAVPASKATTSLNDAVEKSKDVEAGNRREALHLNISDSKNFGVLFCIVLLLVILITNVPLRGLWSFVVLIVIVMMSVILYLADWWPRIISVFSVLDIHINMGGYVFLSTVLFIIWLVTFLWFDRMVYMVFTPGQLKVREEIGGGEAAYDTTGMVVRKQRDDLFRHWILGLGSGDLVVRTSGAQSHEFNLHNVLFVGRKLQLIEEMQRDRPVVAGN